MAFNFNTNLSDLVSQVRFHIGDTVAPGKVADETINAILSGGTSVLGTSAKIAWSLSAQYAGVSEVTVDDQTVKGADISAKYAALAKRLEEQDGQQPTANGASYGGGILVQGLYDCSKPTDPSCCDRPGFFPW